jgi:hypothetical protein
MGLCVLCVHGHTLQGNQLWLCRAISKSLQGNLKKIDNNGGINMEKLQHLPSDSLRESQMVLFSSFFDAFKIKSLTSLFYNGEAFVGAKSTSIRDCVRRSVRWLVGWSVRPPRCNYVEN